MKVLLLSLSTFNLRGSLLAAEAYRLKASGFEFSYTGQYAFDGDPEGDWELQLLTSGELTVDSIAGPVDVFLVGGGGGGGGAYDNGNSAYIYCGGGGGGGYTKTVSAMELTTDTYTATVGAGGTGGVRYSTGYETSNTSATSGGTSSFNGSSITGGSKGGNGKTSTTRGSGGTGGSGGGGGNKTSAGGAGGTDGGNGGRGSSTSITGGKGQGTTTREFGNTSGTLYSSGGDGGGSNVTIAGSANTGNGGGGGYCKNPTNAGSYKDDVTNGFNGGSGIIIIRNARS